MIAGLETLDALGMFFALLLTLLVLTYVFGDNALFRLATHAFIGVGAGYAGAVVLRDVLIPQLASLSGTDFIIALLLVTLLAMKLSPKTAALGNPASGLLVGVGAAIAIGGAIQGTIFPLVGGAGSFFDAGFLQGIVLLFGAAATLAHFHFSAKYIPNQIPERPRFIQITSKIGQVFIAITFGVIFAGIYTAALTALIERFSSIVEFIKLFLQAR